jgi:hypothetical protein
MRIIGEVNGASGYAEPGRDLGPEPPLGASPGCVIWRGSRQSELPILPRY